MASLWTVRLREAIEQSKFAQILLLVIVTSQLVSCLPPHLANGFPVDDRQRYRRSTGEQVALDESLSNSVKTFDRTAGKAAGTSQGLTKAMEMFHNLRRMLSERVLLTSSLSAGAGDSDEPGNRKLTQETTAGSSIQMEREPSKRNLLFEPPAQYSPSRGSYGSSSSSNHGHRLRHSRTHHHNYPASSNVQSSSELAEQSAAGKLSLGEFRINANLHLSSDFDEEDEDDDGVVTSAPTTATASSSSSGPSSSRRQRLKFLEIGREAERKLQAAVTLAANAYECPRVHGKITQLLCPSRRLHGYRVCIDESALCNGKPDCPYGEDEDAVSCLFYKTTMRYFKTVVDTVVELTDVMFRQQKHLEEL